MNSKAVPSSTRRPRPSAPRSNLFAPQPFSAEPLGDEEDGEGRCRQGRRAEDIEGEGQGRMQASMQKLPRSRSLGSSHLRIKMRGFQAL